MSERDSRGRFTKSVARAFQVGDRVWIKDHCDDPSGHHGFKGEIIYDDGTDEAPLTVRCEDGRTAIYDHDDLELVFPAHHPKADEPLADKDAEIVTLRAERDSARSEMMENYRNYREAQDRADAAEAKLADIQAIMRTFKIMETLKGDASFTEAVEMVLEGKVA
jgi:hypothetical protein